MNFWMIVFSIRISQKQKKKVKGNFFVNMLGLGMEEFVSTDISLYFLTL